MRFLLQFDFLTQAAEAQMGSEMSLGWRFYSRLFHIPKRLKRKTERVGAPEGKPAPHMAAPLLLVPECVRTRLKHCK